MSTRDFNVAIHEDDDGSIWGEVVELPGCFVSAHSLDELREAIEEAISLYLHDDPSATKIRPRPANRSVAVDSIRVTMPTPA